MTLRDLLVISGLCFLTEDADEAIRLSLTKEIVHLFGEDAFERMDAIEASNEETVEVILQILRSLAVDQELLDVKAGIPARDAEIEALRKEIETLRSAQAQQPVSGADRLPIELCGISKAIGDGGGFWRSCSGCHELNEGMATGPFSETFKCHLGVGCSECGGIGAIWDTTDYDAMADFMAAEYQQRTENTEPVGQDQLRDAAQMIEPSGNSEELGELKAFEIELRRQCFQPPPHEARDLSWSMWQARAALAQQDGHKTAFEEWVRKTEFIQDWMSSKNLPVKYLGWHRADVMRDLLSQQDADKVDAERWRAYRAAIAAEDSAFLGRAESYLSSLGLRAEVLPTEGQIDGAIDAALKEAAHG